MYLHLVDFYTIHECYGFCCMWINSACFILSPLTQHEKKSPKEPRLTWLKWAQSSDEPNAVAGLATSWQFENDWDGFEKYWSWGQKCSYFKHIQPGNLACVLKNDGLKKYFLFDKAILGIKVKIVVALGWKLGCQIYGLVTKSSLYMTVTSVRFQSSIFWGNNDYGRNPSLSLL